MGGGEVISQIELGKEARMRSYIREEEGTLVFDSKRRNLGKSCQQRHELSPVKGGA